MRKISTLFQRGPDFFVIDKLTPGLEWVAAGEGVPTRKFDGVCVGVEDGHLFTRREATIGQPAPPGWKQSGAPNLDNNKTPGWQPYAHSGHKKLIDEAVQRARHLGVLVDGTYELVGPKVNRNPEGYPEHTLVRHGVHVIDDLDTDLEDLSFDRLRTWLLAHPYEGIVWWRKPGNPDAGLAKLKRRDFTR